MKKSVIGKALWAIIIGNSLLALAQSGCFLPPWQGSKMKSIQSEARTNLAAIFTASIAYYGESGKFGGTFEEINFSPVGETRYSFYLNSCDELIPSAKTGYKGCPDELKAWFARSCDKKTGCPRAAAVANLDKDPKLDIWVVEIGSSPIILTNLVNDIVK